MFAIDIGNSNIALGLFKDGHLVKKTKMSTREGVLYARRIKTLLGNTVPSHIVISSVVPEALRRIKKILRKTDDPKIIILGENADVQIKNLYRVKRQVGQDRLVNAYGAKSFYGAPAVIIDFGTAITFDIVSGKGEYLGGLILPGIEMSLATLYEETALLPKVKLAPAGNIIGKDTVSSMRGGILFGFGAMCDALVARYRKVVGDGLKVIATGGNSSLMKRYAKSIQKVDEDLTLKGLELLSRTLR
jgi:type III pantothenate kinase